jgi:hypothetical protein
MTKEEIIALLKEELSNGFISKDDFGRTAALINRMNKAIEGLAGGMLSLDKLVELGLLEKDGESFKAKVTSPAQKKEGGNAGDPEWKLEIDKLNAEIRKRDEALVNERKKTAETDRKSAVIAALTKAGAVNPERDHVHIFSAVEKGENGYFVRGKDEYGAESQVSLDDHVNSYLKANPELRKAATQPGAGTPKGSQTHGKGSLDINALAAMSTEQYFAERAKAR